MHSPQEEPLQRQATKRGHPARWLHNGTLRPLEGGGAACALLVPGLCLAGACAWLVSWSATVHCCWLRLLPVTLFLPLHAPLLLLLLLLLHMHNGPTFFFACSLLLPTPHTHKQTPPMCCTTGLTLDPCPK